MDLEKNSQNEPLYGEYEGEKLAGFDTFELEKIAILLQLTEKLAYQIKVYKALKDFAARKGVDISGIDVTDEFSSTGKFQEKYKERLKNARDGREHIIMIFSSFYEKSKELESRITAHDPSLKRVWQNEHPEFFVFPEHLL